MSDVYSLLFDRILSGYYPVDAQLREEDLSEELEINRKQIRNVLNQLLQDGLVTKSPKKGTRVTGFTVDDVDELYELRKMLEARALRYAIPSLKISQLKKFRSEILNLQYSENYEEYKKVDAKLHTYFIKASGKKRLIRMLDQLYRIIQSFRELGYKDQDARERGINEHVALIDALIMKDVEGAVKILEDHITKGKYNAIIQL